MSQWSYLPLGLTAANIATQVKLLFLQMIITIPSGRTLLDNGSGDLTITYSALDGEVVISTVSFTDSDPAVSSTINETEPTET